MSKTMKPIMSAILFYLCLSFSSILYASALNDKMLSVEFNNISLSDALVKLKEASGVSIVLNRAMDQNRILNKKYNNSSLDDIILDIFSDDNITASFRYKNNKLSSIAIWMLPRVKGGDNMPALLSRGRNSVKSVNEKVTPAGTTPIDTSDDASNNTNIKPDTDQEESSIDEGEGKILNIGGVSKTVSSASDVKVSKKDVKQNQSSNNDARNEAIKNAVSKGTTEIPAPPEVNETLVTDAPPMPPGM